jgi:hypothetical protein
MNLPMMYGGKVKSINLNVADIQVFLLPNLLRLPAIFTAFAFLLLDILGEFYRVQTI